jgi:hypothetical protein
MMDEKFTCDLYEEEEDDGGKGEPPATFSSAELQSTDRLCDLVTRVPGYRSRGPGFDSWNYQIFKEVVGLEQGPLILMNITKELLEWKISGSGCGKLR